MGVVMERWCLTQQMLGVFLKETEVKKLLFAGTTVLLMATSASGQSSGPGMGLYSGIARHPRGGCGEVCRAKCDATWRFSRFRNVGVGACYAYWSQLNATPEKARECEKAHHSGQRISGC